MKQIYHVLILALLSPALAFAQSANDDCAGAIEIIVDGNSVLVDNTDATIGGIDTTGCYDVESGDLWYTFTLTEETGITIETEEGTSDDSQIALYTIEDCGGENETYTELACSEDIGFFNWLSSINTILDPGTFYIRASVFGDTTGTYSLSVTSFDATPPANDDCSGASEIVVDGDSVMVDITLATAINGPTPDCYFGGQQSGDVWYTFTLTEETGIFIETEAGSNSDSQISLYSIEDCGGDDEAYTEIDCDDDNGEGLLSVIYGTYGPGTYYIKAGVYGNNVGDYALSVSSFDTIPPANDSCSTAEEIIVDGDSVMVEVTLAATSSGPAPSCYTPSTGNIWYSFTLDEATDLAIEAEAGTLASTQFSLFSIDDCGGEAEAYTEIACSTSEIIASLEAGTYFISASTGVIAEGNFFISVFTVSIPENDNCADVTEFPTLDTNGALQFTGSTEYSTPNDLLTTAHVWEAFVLEGCANVTLSYCSNDTTSNAYINLFSNCELDTFFTATYDFTSCENGNPTLYFDGLEAGTYYYPVMNTNEFTDYTLEVSAVEIDCPVEPVFVEGAESFEDGTLPECWTVMDQDGDGNSWTVTDGVEGFDGSFAIRTDSYINDVGALTPDNYLISPQLELGENDSLYYVVRSVDAAYPAENYSILVSTTGNEIADFTDEVFTEVLSSDIWQGRSIDLSDYSNQTIYIAFRHHDVSDQYAMLIDAIALPGEALDCTIGVTELSSGSLSLYPNPSNGTFNITSEGITGKVLVEIFDLKGAKVYSAQDVFAKENTATLDISQNEPGIYLARFITETGVKTMKLVVE